MTREQFEILTEYIKALITDSTSDHIQDAVRLDNIRLDAERLLITEFER